MSYTYSSSGLMDANRVTATTADQVIAMATAFKYVSVFNEGSVELRITIDGDSTQPNKIIFVAPNQGFEHALSGKTLHYSVASGTASFKYLLR